MCWTTPGIEEIGCGSSSPLADEHRQHELSGLERRLGDQPAQGRGGAQPTRPDHGADRPGDGVAGREDPFVAHRDEEALRRVAGLRSDGFATG